MSQQTQSLLLLGYIALFALLQIAFMRRETRLGWAFTVQNGGYFLAFTYGAVLTVRPELRENMGLGQIVRILLGLSMTWATYELVRMQASALWREDDDAHGEAMHAHGRTQGRLEGMAEEQADERQRRDTDPNTVGGVHLVESVDTVGQTPTKRNGDRP